MSSHKNTPEHTAILVIPENYKQPLKELIISGLDNIKNSPKLSGIDIRRFIQSLEIIGIRLPGTYPNEDFNVKWNEFISITLKTATEKPVQCRTLQVNDKELQAFLHTLITMGLLEESNDTIEIIKTKINKLLNKNNPAE